MQTQFENGELILTSHRLLWQNPQIDARSLYLPLQLVLLLGEESAGFMKSAKVVLTLGRPISGEFLRHFPSLGDMLLKNNGIAGAPPGPTHRSATDVVKLSFKQGGEKGFTQRLHDALKQRQWEATVNIRPLPP